MEIKIKPIQILDLIVFISCIIALGEIISFIFLGSIYSWILMMERFPHLKFLIVLVFKYMRYYLIILIIGLIYYIIRQVAKLFKKEKKNATK